MTKTRWKLIALTGLAGTLMMWGAGSCLPYNFYSGLLGDTIIAGFLGTVASNVASNTVPVQ